MMDSPGEGPGEDYTAVFRRILGRLASEQERARDEGAAAGGLYDELMEMPGAEREPAIRGSESFSSLALAGRLLDAGLEVRREDAEAGLELSRLALAVAKRLAPDRYAPGLVADLRARCWACLGDGWAKADPTGARRAFRRARRHLLRGSGDPLAEAEVLCLEAQLLEPAAAAGAAVGGPTRFQ